MNDLQNSAERILTLDLSSEKRRLYWRFAICQPQRGLFSGFASSGHFVITAHGFQLGEVGARIRNGSRATTASEFTVPQCEPLYIFRQGVSSPRLGLHSDSLRRKCAHSRLKWRAAASAMTTAAMAAAALASQARARRNNPGTDASMELFCVNYFTMQKSLIK